MSILNGTNKADVIRGTAGADVIKGGAGNDRIFAGAGNDTVHADGGSDVVLGGAGNDLLIGDAEGEAVFKTDLLSIAKDYTVKVTFDFEEAGYRNTLGVYKVNPKTGEFSDVKIMFENASLKGSGGDLIGGQSSFDIPVSAGEKLGFFLIGNGASTNNFAKMGKGEFSFVDSQGKPATIDSVAAKLVHTGANGKQTAVDGPVYHTAGFGDRAKLNADQIEHTMGYKKNNEGSFQIGFEDLWKGGDRDFDDAVFTVDIGAANVKVLNEHYTNVLQPATVNAQVNKQSYMQTEAGNDRLLGGAGADTLMGMQGNDLLAGGGAGAEWKLVGGKWVYNAKAVVSGKAAVLDKSGDSLVGGTGDDVLLGGAGNDTLSGGDGNDTLNAGRGNDNAAGGAGNDTINLEDGNDTGFGGDGNDVINAGAGDDLVMGEAGDDSLRGGDGNDTLLGGDGKDDLAGGAGNDSLSGGAGDDKLLGGDGADVIEGGTGNDLAEGGEGADTLRGDAGNDTLNAGAGDDVVDGGDGDDMLRGAEGSDRLSGGTGNDTAEGGVGDDTLDGGVGNDSLMGGDGRDMLLGGAGNDTLVGGAGSDRVEGGAGNDALWGGSWKADGARDTFVHQPGGGRDVVNDFETAHDQIDLSSYGLTFKDLAGRIADKGMGAEIDLSGLPNAQAGDVLVLKSVKVAALTEDKFIL